MRKVFILTKSQKAKRFEFLKFMKRKQISPEDILFTDESIFYLSFLNGNCKVRICKKTQKKLKNGNDKAINLIVRPTHKKANGVMISGAISKNGLGHLIMHSGNINTFAYKQSLNFYKEDIHNL